MARKKLSLTRDQLASFLNDFEQIKQFELLFSTVDTIDELTLDEINVSAGTANAAANNALAQISALTDQTALLSLAPPDLGGTVTSVGLSGGTTGITITGPNPITTSGTFILGGTLGIANGGTGATTAAGARANLEAAKSGANSDITSLSGITGSISTVDSITFDTAAAITVGQGQIAWNSADGTLDIGMGYDAVTQQVGLEQYFRIKASAAITNGQCVMFTGAVGSSGVLTGAPATGVTNPQYIMGVATMDIANNGFGYITSFGLVRGINTTGSSVGETWADGDILYYNPAYTGGLTKVEPIAPLPKVVVASVVNAGPGGSGSLFIRVQAEPYLQGLTDVYAPSPIANGQILIGDGPQSRWESATLTAGSGVSISNGAGSITISATGSGGTVTSVSVVSANGLAGTVANATTTPAITLSTTVTGIVKGNGTALSAAIAGTDYVAPGAITTSGLTMATARILGRTTASTGAVEEIGVGTGLSLSAGSLTNSAPDQVVSLTGAGTTVVTGTYPSFTITSNDQYVGTVTSVSGTGSVNGITLTGTVTSSGSLTLGGTLSNVSLTSQVTGTLPVTNGGTGTATAFTTGSVVFAGASGVYAQDNANLFWDDTNNRLGIGTSAPGAALQINKASGAADVYLSIGGTVYGNFYASSFDTTITSVTAIPLILGTNNTTRFQVGPAGQWGIGGASYGTAGQVLTSGGAIAAPTWTTPTTGTVTSVSGTGTVNGITLTGTVTSTGSLTLGGTLSGVSLTSQVSGTLPIANGGTGSTSTTYCSLTTNVTGTLPVGNGGTGATTFTANALLKGNGTSAVSASNVSDNGSTVSIGSGIGFSIARTTVTSPAAADGNVFSGTYTPTSFNTTNIAASTPQSAQYLRVGNTVTVSGQIDIDPTATGFALLGLSLPIASAITSAVQLSGVFNCPDAAGGGVYGDATNDRATFQFTASSAANLTYYYTFTYRVL